MIHAHLLGLASQQQRTGSGHNPPMRADKAASLKHLKRPGTLARQTIFEGTDMKQVR